MLLLILAALLLHSLMLIFNSAAAAAMRLPMPEATCVVIMASQKVGVAPGRGGPAGVTVRPAGNGDLDAVPLPPPAAPAAGMDGSQSRGPRRGGCRTRGVRAPPAYHTSPPPRHPPQSAPVAVTVITYVASGAATQGLLAVPCVVGQLVQIFMDQVCCV